jgi:hypothetical protein
MFMKIAGIQEVMSLLLQAFDSWKAGWDWRKLLLALALLGCAFSALAGQGGGYTQAGLQGAYYTNSLFGGAPGFTRRDVRLDFGASSLPPGGAGQHGDLAFRSVPAENFSVRWTGRLVPRFTETYAFKSIGSGTFQLRLRAAGAADWTTVISAAQAGTNTGSLALIASNTFDIELSFAHATGPWTARLLWSSPSLPEEVIDPLMQAGINNPEWSSGFTDIIKGARNSWEPASGTNRPAMDTNGWPTSDAAYVFQESLNQGMDIDPLMRGLISFSFKGKATVSVRGNVKSGSLAYQYNAASNLTTGSFVGASNGWNATYLYFVSSTRTGFTGGPGGFTDLRLMRPAAPDAATSHPAEDSLFTPQLLDAMSHFTVIRHQLVANQQKEWSERTRPGYFNQSGGAVSSPHYGVGDDSDNGASWEHKVMLANESGRDLMLSLPTVASGRLTTDTGSYLWKLANLLRYGSDGVEPYTSPVSNPVYPPLNPNLRVYLELENELWNWASVFSTDFGNINQLTAADAAANNADFQIINFDSLTTATNSSGEYSSIYTWRYRKIMLRLFQISDIFRSVFGDSGMMTRVRPLYEWQYANANSTADLALTFADNYFNNADGKPHVATPNPVSHWLWGGGGASYYGAVNGNGLTTLLSNSAFSTPALSAPGYQAAPAGAGWVFSGTAGIARDGGTNDDIPVPYSGSQVGYLTGKGQATISVTFPTAVTSAVFAVSFKAVNRQPTNTASADRENLRVFLDGTNDITARSYSQGNGYTPLAYNSGYPWRANNVAWTFSDYFYTRCFKVAPGSTHTLTFAGQGNLTNSSLLDQTVFLGEVRVTSVDRIFADGMPGGGEATGQPVGDNIRSVMNNEASWAKAFGLEQLAYESGWSLGGDDGGSWLQLAAKYGDARTGEVQGRFMDYFARSGSAVVVFGTYAQWPDWADYYAEQGLLNVSNYPIVQGIDNRCSRLPEEPDNGTLTPAVLGTPQITLSHNATTSPARITSAGGWLTWNLAVGRSGYYTLTLTNSSTNTTALLLLDDQKLATCYGGTNAVTDSTWITKGFHSLKVRGVSTNAFQVQAITVASSVAPASPQVLAAVEGDSQVSLTWTAVTGATGYQVRYGTSPGIYTAELEAGSSTNLTITGLANDQQYYFVVIASGISGDSLPSAERGVIPLGVGQLGRLAVWEFNGYSGSEVQAPVSSASSRIAVTALTRGAGLSPSTASWAATLRPNRFASEPASSQGNRYGTNLAQSIASAQYYEFAVTPAAGQRMSLSQLSFLAYFQNAAGNMGLGWSTNGLDFSTNLVVIGSPGSPTNLWTVDLSGQPALQACAGKVIFRLYCFGAGSYQVTGLGNSSGDDVTLTGSLEPEKVALQIASLPSGSLQLAWLTNSLDLHLESSTNLSTGSWARVSQTASVSAGSNTLVLPPGATSLFFRLVK